jgi:pilin/secretion family protein with methylation motif
MKHRSGVTLVEVLVAIFVMGIGLIALLTLFPIGMLRMARAIHDESSAQSAQNAHANAIVYNLSQDIDVNTDPNGNFNGGRPYDVFDNPAPRSPLNNSANFLLKADPNFESYPIFVDPIGYYNVTGQAQNWVGGVPPTTNRLPQTANSHHGGLRRRGTTFVRLDINGNPLSVPNRNLQIYQSFTLWDDLVFDGVTNPGAPQSVAGTIMRDPRFSWGYTMQRPLSSDKSVVNCSIVIFDKRSLSISGNGTLAENVYANNTYFNPGNQSITIDYTNPNVVPPPVRPGDWIMDVTPYNPTPTSGAAHAYWYRVVATEELIDGANKYVRFEVQQPIRGVTASKITFPITTIATSPSGAITLGYRGTSVIMDGVAEVFDKGPIRLP